MTTEPRKFIRLVGGEAGWDFWMAMAIAGTLQLGLMLYLRRANRKFSRVLALFAALFLLVTVLTGIRHDYIVKVQIWNVVRQLGTPWWSSDEWGLQNVYGPLFNLFAFLTPISTLAPKVLFAFAYVIFVTWMASFVRDRPPWAVVVAWLLNPLPWLLVAGSGHFDVLIGLLCVAAVHAQRIGRDAMAGSALAAGVLLKFMPLAIVPFLAFEHRRVRLRLIAVFSAITAAGLAASVLVWGWETFAPPFGLVTHGPTGLSLFRFLQGDLFRPWLDEAAVAALAKPSMIAAGLVLFIAFLWRSISASTGAVMAVLVTVLFYPIALVHYQIVLFMLAAYWYLTFPDRRWLWNDRLCSVAVVAYFNWLGVYCLFYYGVGISNYYWRWGWIEDVVGLPTFLLGLLLFLALWRASRIESTVTDCRGGVGERRGRHPAVG